MIVTSLLFAATAGTLASNGQATIGSSGVVMLQMPNAHTSRKGDGEPEQLPEQESQQAAKAEASSSLLQESANDLPDASLGQVDEHIKESGAGAACEHAPIYIGTCFSTTYGVITVLLLLLVVLLVVDAIMNRKTIQRQASKIRALRCNLHAQKQLIKADEKELRNMVAALEGQHKDRYQDIINRGWVQLDLGSKQLILKRGIEFTDMRRGAGRTTFCEPTEAHIVLNDVADMLRIFHSAVVLIEGHTATPLDQLDDFAHEVAFSRAELVKLELMSLGIEEYRLDAIGLPGDLGRNENKVVLNFIGI